MNLTVPTKIPHPFANADIQGFHNDGNLGGWDDSTFSAALQLTPGDNLEMSLSYYGTEIQREFQDSYVLNGLREVGAAISGTSFFDDLNYNPKTLVVPGRGGAPDQRTTGNTLWQGELPTTPGPGTFIGPVSATAEDQAVHRAVDPRGYGAIANTDLYSFNLAWDINDRWRLKYQFGDIEHDSLTNGPAARDALRGTSYFNGINFMATPPASIYNYASTFSSRPNSFMDQQSHELRVDWTGDRLTASLGAYYSETDDEHYDVTVFAPVCSDRDVNGDGNNADEIANCNQRVSPQTESVLPDPPFLAIYDIFNDYWHGTPSNHARFEDKVAAIFADLDYQVTDQLTLRAELRYTQEDRKIKRLAGIFGLAPGQTVMGVSQLMARSRPVLETVQIPVTGPMGPVVDAMGNIMMMDLIGPDGMPVQRPVIAPVQIPVIGPMGPVRDAMGNIVTMDLIGPDGMPVEAPVFEDIINPATGEQLVTPDVISQTSTITVPDDDETFSYVTTRLSAQWAVSDDSLLYAYIANGVKSGGFNNSVSDLTYDEEENWTLELGSKNTLFGNRLMFNFAAYAVNWKDVQGSGSDSTASANANIVTRNIGDATSLGFEFETALRLNDAWGIEFAYARSNPTYDDNARYDAAQRYYYYNCDKAVVTDGELCGDTDISDKRLARTSQHQALAALTYDRQRDDGWDVSARLEGSYQSKQYLTPLNVGYIAGRTLYNGTLNFISPEGRWDITFWSKNLTNEKYVQSQFTVSFDNRFLVALGQEQTSGASVKYNF